MASAQLELVLRLAQEAEQTAARALGEAQAQREDVEAQLRQILEYQEDYRAMARGEQGQGLTASQLAEARRFLTEINSLVEAQRGQRDQVDQLVLRQQQAWAEAARYTRAIDKLARDRAMAAQQAAEKRQQQQLDDFYGQQQFFQM